MGASIHVQPENVWSFFQKNRERLSEEMVAIAENGDTEYAVYLTEEDGYPLLCVCKGDDAPEYEEGAVNERDCANTAKRCYTQYLFPVTVTSKKAENYFVGQDESKETLALQEREDAICAREDELLFAICDFLQVVLAETCFEVTELYDEETLMEILDGILEKLASDYNMTIYRPMMVEDAAGDEVYTEYPYGKPEYEEI